MGKTFHEEWGRGWGVGAEARNKRGSDDCLATHALSLMLLGALSGLFLS